VHNGGSTHTCDEYQRSFCLLSDGIGSEKNFSRNKVFSASSNNKNFFRKCVETRIQLMRDNDKQENILLSVLPKYIANDMKKGNFYQYTSVKH
jgi:hypothetical protein